MSATHMTDLELANFFDFLGPSFESSHLYLLVLVEIPTTIWVRLFEINTISIYFLLDAYYNHKKHNQTLYIQKEI